MEENTNLYEIAFILQQEDASEVRKILEKNRVEVVDEKDLEKIRLAYPINKQKFGFFGKYVFKVEPDFVKGVFSDLKLTKNVIRYMINRMKTEAFEKSDKKRKKTVLQSRESKEEKTPIIENKTRKFVAPTLTNEELEKKIEEILK